MMKRFSFILLVLLSLFLIAACQPTGDSNTDPEAAQSFFPELSGYQVEQTDTLQDALTSALTGAGLSTGNLVASGLVLQVDSFIDCYREVGAFDARIYIEQPTDSLITEGVRLPYGGVVVIVNEDRLLENLGACLTQNPLGGASAQAATPQPCFGNGSFEFNGDSIGYLYAATDRPLCGLFQQHFDTYKAG